MIKEIKTILFVTLLIVSCKTDKNVVATQHNREKFGKLEFDERILNFGSVNQDSTISAKFSCKNVGKDTLTIEYVNPDCSCTAFNVSSYVFAPSDSGYVDLELNTKDKRGEIKLCVVVKTDGQTKFHKLMLQGIIN